MPLDRLIAGMGWSPSEISQPALGDDACLHAGRVAERVKDL
jgi:hypothetical protein